MTVDLPKNRVIRNNLDRILVSRTILWLAVGAMMFHRQALALDTQKAITQFSHRTWGVADHIEEVNAICQTTDGFLWIATINGLFRFDGSAFVQWEPKPGEPGLPGTPNELLGARDGSLWVSVELDPNLPAIIGDSVQLQQVLLNLIMNAVEAMGSVRDRGKLLRIRSARGDLDGMPAISAEVIDNGTGFSNKDAERLFEAFYTSKPEGMGMGLWVSRSIIEAHGGRLTARPNESPGATFQILLPAERGNPN